MLQSEFNDRIGWKSTDEEYETANAIYMGAHEMDKDQFCDLWRQHHDNPFVLVCIKQMKSLWTEQYQNNELIREKEQERDAFADTLAQMQQTQEEQKVTDARTILYWMQVEDADRLRTLMQNAVNDLIPHKTQLIERFRAGYALSDEERAELINLIKA